MSTHHLRRPNGVLRRAVRASYKGLGRLLTFCIKYAAIGFLAAVGAALAVLWGITQVSGGDITKVFTEVSLESVLDFSTLELPPVEVILSGEQQQLELSETDRALLRALIEAQVGVTP